MHNTARYSTMYSLLNESECKRLFTGFKWEKPDSVESLFTMRSVAAAEHGEQWKQRVFTIAAKIFPVGGAVVLRKTPQATVPKKQPIVSHS